MDWRDQNVKVEIVWFTRCILNRLCLLHCVITHAELNSRPLQLAVHIFLLIYPNLFCSDSAFLA